MVSTDRKTVAVAAGDEDGEVGTGYFQPGGKGEGTAVDAVKPVAVGVGRDARRAADPRDNRDLFRRKGEFGQRPLEGDQHRMVAASGTPNGFNRRLVIGWDEGFGDVWDHVHARAPS